MTDGDSRQTGRKIVAGIIGLLVVLVYFVVVFSVGVVAGGAGVGEIVFLTLGLSTLTFLLAYVLVRLFVLQISISVIVGLGLSIGVLDNALDVSFFRIADMPFGVSIGIEL